MPIKAKAKAKPRKKAPQAGKGIFDIFSGINKLLKKSKIISTLAPLAGAYGVPAAAISGALGYGKKKAKPKKKMMRGRGLGQPGHGLGRGLSLAGNKNPIR
jgi:hypothetical protein